MKTNKLWTVLIATVLSLSLALGLGSSMLASTAQGTLTADQIDAIVNTTTDQTKVTSPFVEIVRNAQQSVVGVNNYQTRRIVSQFGYNFRFPFEQSPESTSQERKMGTGSGTVISPYGHVLTNYHVIEDATRTTISVGERELDATIVGSDSNLDIAVLLVPGLDLPAVPLGDSDAIQVGEYAIVIGNPLGQQFERSVSLGVVSAVSRMMTSTGRDRYGLRTETQNSMIQVDAAISSGNSGGGLFNTLGQLQGIPTLKLVDGISSFFSSSSYSVDNIGMCVPINVAKPLIRSVLENYDAQAVEAEATRVREEEARKAEQADKPRPRIGVKIDTVGRYLPASQGIVPRGAFIAEVEENSPAQAAGLKVGDIIVEADGEIITTQTQLIEKLQTLKEGDYVQLKVYRVTGLLDALQNTNKLSELGKGEYLDIKVQLLILDKTNM